MLTIQQADIGAIPLIRELARNVWEVTYKDILSDHQFEYMMDMMYSNPSLEKQFESGVFYTAYSNGSFIGFISLQKQQNTLNLDKLYILPAKQSKGVGSALINKAIALAIKFNCTSIQLFVNRNNKAVDFYKKMGFEIKGERDHHIGNQYYMNDYIMYKQL